MVERLQALRLDEELIESFRRFLEFLVLVVFPDEGLDHSYGLYVLLYGLVEVVVFDEHLREELDGLCDDEEEGTSENDHGHDEDDAHLPVDEHAHEDTENEVERCPDRCPEDLLECVLQVAHVGCHARDES